MRRACSSATALQGAGRGTYACETTIGDERRLSLSTFAGIGEDEFVRMRTARDATLAMPRLLLPLGPGQHARGQMPPAGSNGLSYLKLPLDAL